MVRGRSRLHRLEGAELAAFAIADNRTAELSGWDVGALSASLAALKEEDEDLFAATGFDDVALAQALDGIDPGGSGSMDDGDGVPDAPREIIEDEAPEAPKRAVSKTGDLWLLGEHRLLCGDSTKAEEVERLMAGAKAGAVITDPPYGINMDGIQNDAPEGLPELFRGCLVAMPSNSAVVMAFQSPRLFPVWLDAVREAGHKFERSLWWREEAMAYPWRGFRMQGEIILISSIGKPDWDERDSHPDTFEDNNPHRDGHPTQKPVSLIVALVSHTVGLVYDPFLGSGTTLIAAEQLDRKCYGLELEPRYVDVIVQRWEKLTGKQATLDGSGMTFEEAKSARWEQ